MGFIDRLVAWFRRPAEAEKSKAAAAARARIERAADRIEMADLLSTDLTMPAFKKMHTLVAPQRPKRETDVQR